MAKQTIVTLLDDLDESLADETVEFSLDGRNYEIDLSDKNAKKLREGLKKFVDAARRAGRAQTSSRASSSVSTRSTADREKNQKIREWALAHGYNVSDRGRLPMNVIEDYNAGKPAGNLVAQTAAKDEEPEFADPDPVESIKWNDLSGMSRTEIKMWTRSNDISDEWLKNPKHRNEMATFHLNNDMKGARKYVNSL